MLNLALSTPTLARFSRTRGGTNVQLHLKCAIAASFQIASVPPACRILMIISDIKTRHLIVNALTIKHKNPLATVPMTGFLKFGNEGVMMLL
jgi:hypothetical protein